MHRSNFLQHYGVKGMKWGEVHEDKTASGSRSATIQKFAAVGTVALAKTLTSGSLKKSFSKAISLKSTPKAKNTTSAVETPSPIAQETTSAIESESKIVKASSNKNTGSIKTKTSSSRSSQTASNKLEQSIDNLSNGAATDEEKKKILAMQESLDNAGLSNTFSVKPVKKGKKYVGVITHTKSGKTFTSVSKAKSYAKSLSGTTKTSSTSKTSKSSKTTGTGPNWTPHKGPSERFYIPSDSSPTETKTKTASMVKTKSKTKSTPIPIETTSAIEYVPKEQKFSAINSILSSNGAKTMSKALGGIGKVTAATILSKRKK